MSTQHVWANALLDPSLPVPQGLNTWNLSDPARRLAVYRNNVFVSLVDALTHTFPVTQQLVGEEFFRAMAQVFVRAHPPRSPVLSRYGRALPDFIEQFAPAAGVPYLADLARLESLRLEALHAADALPLGPGALEALLVDAERLARLRWQLHPSLRWLRSAHAVVSLWAAHQGDHGSSIEDVDPTRPEAALVFRSGLDVMVLQTDDGLAALCAGLMEGRTLSDAVEAALDAEPAFDTSQALAVLIRHGLLVGFESPH